MSAPDSNLPDNSTAHAVECDACSAPPLTLEALESGLWRPMESAPRDGSVVWIWIRHPYFAYASESGLEDEYQAAERARWIDHNGGGWTWHGLFGRQVAWAPISQNTESARDEGEKP